MADFHVLTNASEHLDIPEVRQLTIGDLFAALAEGWRDFWQKPSHLAFLGLIYPLVGGALGIWSSGNNAWPLLFPLIAGFALVGPVAALAPALAFLARAGDLRSGLCIGCARRAGLS